MPIPDWCPMATSRRQQSALRGGDDQPGTNWRRRGEAASHSKGFLLHIPRVVGSIRFLAAFILMLAPRQVSAQSPSTPQEPSERQREVETGLTTWVSITGEPERRHTIAERMKHYHVPGLSIAVINGGEIEWARGYGVTEHGGTTRVDTATLFQAGSISKPVAATGALLLVERGMLALDEDVNARLTSWRVPENEYTREQKVTLRRILTHSAGLTVHGFPGYRAGVELPSLTQVLDGVIPANTEPVRVNVVPGTEGRYSGGGITVMQLLMQDVTGEPFPILMQRRVLGPLGMVHSTYEQPLPDAPGRIAATGHEQLDTPVPGRFHTYPEMAAAGLWTTPSDLARWAIELQRARAGEPGRVLSPEMAGQMLSPQFDGWGLGVQLVGSDSSTMFFHGGRNEGFLATLRAFVSHGQGVVIMTNGISDKLLAEVGRSVARTYGWSLPERPTRTRAPVDSVSLDHLVGRYSLVIGRDTSTLEVTREAARLFIQQTGGIRGELIPEGELSFFDPDDGTDFVFVREPTASAATLITIQMGNQTFTAQRAPIEVR